jgi:hypothetical protein
VDPYCVGLCTSRTGVASAHSSSLTAFFVFALCLLLACLLVAGVVAGSLVVGRGLHLYREGERVRELQRLIHLQQ